MEIISVCHPVFCLFVIVQIGFLECEFILIFFSYHCIIFWIHVLFDIYFQIIRIYCFKNWSKFLVDYLLKFNLCYEIPRF